MRSWLALPLLLAAGCGSAPEEAPKTERPASLAPGEWELSSEVTSLASQDDGQPAINTPVGTQATHKVCVSSGASIPGELLSGEGYECRFDNHYARNGRLNSLLTCSREGLQGEIVMTVDGNFEADEVSFTRSIRTILATDGDVMINEQVTGRRSGDCAAGSAAETNGTKAQ